MAWEKREYTLLVCGSALLVFAQKCAVKFLLGLLPRLDRLLEAAIAAQVAPSTLKADGSTPELLFRHPVHPGHTTGIVAALGAGTDHFHAGAVYIGGLGYAAAAGDVAAAQVGGLDDALPATVAAAAPGGPAIHIFRRG